VTSLATVFKLKCTCVLYISYTNKYEEKTFIMEESASAAKQEKRVLSELLEFYLLLHTAYSP
jgi:hypothetical protein